MHGLFRTVESCALAEHKPARRSMASATSILPDQAVVLTVRPQYCGPNGHTAGASSMSLRGCPRTWFALDPCDHHPLILPRIDLQNQTTLVHAKNQAHDTFIKSSRSSSWNIACVRSTMHEISRLTSCPIISRPVRNQSPAVRAPAKGDKVMTFAIYCSTPPTSTIGCGYEALCCCSDPGPTGSAALKYMTQLEGAHRW
jgi:hypothetical protein